MGWSTGTLVHGAGSPPVWGGLRRPTEAFRPTSATACFGRVSSYVDADSIGSYLLRESQS
jgi:hypothetical protein